MRFGVQNGDDQQDTGRYLEIYHQEARLACHSKKFRTKRDAEDWSRRTEDEMVRGVYIQRSQSERLTFSATLDRYLKEITPTKKPSTQIREHNRTSQLR